MQATRDWLQVRREATTDYREPLHHRIAAASHKLLSRCCNAPIEICPTPCDGLFCGRCYLGVPLGCLEGTCCGCPIGASKRAAFVGEATEYDYE